MTNEMLKEAFMHSYIGYIIVIDYNRFGYMTTYFTDIGLTYNINEVKIFDIYNNAKKVFMDLFKNTKRIRNYFGDLTGRKISILKVSCDQDLNVNIVKECNSYYV